MFRSRNFWCLCAAVIFTMTLSSFQGTGGGQGTLSAIYVQGELRTVIPYSASRAGHGSLSVELLSPEDAVLAHVERHIAVTAGEGTWREALRPAKPLAADELVWQRLRYRFHYDGDEPEASASISGIEMISDIIRTPALRIIGQQTWLAGAPAAVRMIVSDSKDQPIAGATSMRIALRTKEGQATPLYSGAANARGTAEAAFRTPAGLTGSYSVEYTADTPIGSASYTQQVRIEDQFSTLITTEKPIYQPGQTVHVRALTLNRASHEALASRKLTFELEDSRGNKIFKEATTTSKFGVASAEFALADEVNLGAWHLRALMDGQHATEIAIHVQRYVLPKFKVSVEFADKDQKAKRGYRPGDHVTGTVRANYFFGKAVDRAEITVVATAMDTGVSEVASAHGTTDDDGTYRFDLRLPEYFVGRPLDHGAARVLIEARVKDNAAHTETRGESVTVSRSPLIITAVPEGGSLIPNLENRIYVLASYPDGTPAIADIQAESQNVSTDAGGVAVIALKATRSDTLQIDASDKEGNRASTQVKLNVRYGDEQILLRTERAIYKTGDRITLKVLSTKQKGTAYVDIIKDGQTILTRDVDLEGGTAELSVPVTGSLAGTLDCNAYLFGANSRPVADHRLIFVQPADELKIVTTTDAREYKPGGEARIGFKVTNSRGEGVQAALGVQAVDEAVFALAEKQPGFAKVFFYLEQQAMKPRYEIHSIGMPDIVQPVETARAAQRDRAALALFSATELANPNRFETATERKTDMAKLRDYQQRYSAQFNEQVRILAAALNRAYVRNSEGGDLAQVAARLAKSDAPEMRDSWGHSFTVRPVQWENQNSRVFEVRTGGVNRLGGYSAYVETTPGKVDNLAPQRTASEIRAGIEPNRGAINGMAEVAGKVYDPAGAAVSHAVVTLRGTSGAKTLRTTQSDPEGSFSLAAIPAGDYDVEVSSPGFRSASRRLSLRPQDRAVLSAVLAVGTVSMSVEVTSAAPMVQVMNGALGRGMGGGFGGGVAGGTAGGVLGGIIGGLPAAAPPPIMAKAILVSRDAVFRNTAAPKEPHTRSWFPEALYINPEIITDQSGAASITIPIADSITTWRMALLASTTHGALGTGTANIKVFQDFFADLDLPVTLTQGDRVSIPVAIYNYTGAAGNVKLQLAKDDWYSLADDAAEKSVSVEAGRVGASQFSVEAKRIGKFKLTLNARMPGPGNHADIVIREIEVIPNGREQNIVFNGRLETSVEHKVAFPASSIDGASKLFVRLYPGPLSQVIEGMDAILRMPGGCFEQTSSSTYPNVLSLDYMKRTKKLTPEIHAKAEGYIATGYQRLLTFEVPGGGFSWFGQAPANKILTSYGLMELYDMAQVHEVDPGVISRTQAWLAGKQQTDGSWAPDTGLVINEGATNRFNSDVLRITAYIAWALENTGYKGAAVEKARKYIEDHMSAGADAYTKAVVANFAADYAKDGAFTARAMKQLLDSKVEKDDHVWWTAEETAVLGRGDSAAVETTGLALQALIKSDEASATVSKGLAWIASKKDASGAWGTTQATIMALRALLLASAKAGSDVTGTVQITLNGVPVKTLTITPANNDLLHQFTFDAKPSSAVGISFSGKGGLGYQVSGRYFVPWDVKPANEALSIDVAFDRTHLAQDDIATATATVRNNLGKTANMVMVDLGIPPGFDLLTEDLQDFQSSGRIEKFSVTATQAILYFKAISANETVRLKYRLRAKYPIRARTFASRVYEYYQPEVNATARPVQLEVVGKRR